LRRNTGVVCSADEEVPGWESGRRRGWMGDAIYAKDRLRLLGFLEVLRWGVESGVDCGGTRTPTSGRQY